MSTRHRFLISQTDRICTTWQTGFRHSTCEAPVEFDCVDLTHHLRPLLPQVRSLGGVIAKGDPRHPPLLELALAIVATR